MFGIMVVVGGAPVVVGLVGKKVSVVVKGSYIYTDK